jgi:hypothetical protein
VRFERLVVGGGSHRVGQGPVELTGDVSLQAASDLLWPFALGSASGDLGPGGRAFAHPGRGDDVDGFVERAIAAAVEPVPHGSSAAGLQGADAAEGSKCGVVSDRPGWGKDTMTWAALTGPIPGRAVSPGARSSTIPASCVRLARSACAASRNARARRRISTCRIAWTVGVAGQSTADEAGEHGCGEPGAGQLAVGVVAGEQ